MRCQFCGGELMTSGCPRCDWSITYRPEVAVSGYADSSAGRVPVYSTRWVRVSPRPPSRRGT